MCKGLLLGLAMEIGLGARPRMHPSTLCICTVVSPRLSPFFLALLFGAPERAWVTPLLVPLIVVNCSHPLPRLDDSGTSRREAVAAQSYYSISS